MRPSSRIVPTLKAIEILWKRYPDMRLGQLLINLDGGEDNLWNLEDDVLDHRVAYVLGHGFEELGKSLKSTDTGDAK